MITAVVEVTMHSNSEVIHVHQLNLLQHICDY